MGTHHVTVLDIVDKSHTLQNTAEQNWLRLERQKPVELIG